MVEKAEQGEAIAITRNGKTVAQLTPAGIAVKQRTEQSMVDDDRAKAVLDAFLQERSTWPRTNITREEILAMRHEGHSR